MGEPVPRTPSPAALAAIAHVARLQTRPAVPVPEALDALIAHVVAVHHRAIRELLGVLTVLSEELGLAPAHVARHRDAVDALVSILAPHLAKEERVLFPGLLQPPRPPGALDTPLRVLAEEHAAAGAAFDELIAASAAVRADSPDDPVVAAIADAVTLLRDLVAHHIALEENVLFPAARQRALAAHHHLEDLP